MHVRKHVSGLAVMWILVAVGGLGASEGAASPDKFAVTPDTELLKRIEALPANTWLKLPPFKVVGELDWLSARADERKRGPFGRSYCNYAVWAPERMRAFYLGGGHNVRRQSDVWEYDLAANAWICLRGADPAGWQKDTEAWFRAHAKMADDGCVITKDDGPVAVSHTWNQFCYDPDRKVALWVNSMPRSIYYSIKLDQEDNPVVKGLGMPFDEYQKKLCKDGIYVWEFDPAKRAFTRREFVFNLKRPGNTTGGRMEEGLMRYIPDRKTVFFNGTMRDPASGEWKALGAKGGPRFYATHGAYCSKDRRFYAFNQGVAYALDFATNAWEKVAEGGPKTYFFYNDAAGVFVGMAWGERGQPLKAVWVFDPAAKSWKQMPAPSGDAPLTGAETIQWYDPARNVHVYYDSRSVYVYRFETASGK